MYFIITLRSCLGDRFPPSSKHDLKTFGGHMARAKQSKTPERAMDPRRRRSVTSHQTQTRRPRRWLRLSASSAARRIVSSTCSAEIKCTLRTFSSNRGHGGGGMRGKGRPQKGQGCCPYETAAKRRPQGLHFFFPCHQNEKEPAKGPRPRLRGAALSQGKKAV